MSKFKNTEELEKAYKELEKEFTEKSQKLAKYEKDNFVCLLNREMDSLLDDYSKRRISDLEAKLAESEKEIKYYANRNVELIDESLNLTRANNIYFDENKHLKQQLAEKEKEIESLKASSDKNIDYLIEFASLIENEKDCNRMLKALDRVKKGKKYIVDKDNQDKISFAVDILEELADCSNYINSKLDFECGSYVSEKAIRDKIKYLKGNEDE